MSASPEFTDDELYELCPFHAVVGPRGEGKHVLGVWAILVEGEVLPVPDEISDMAAEAFERGGLLLIAARSPADRETAKGALQLRFGFPQGRA